MKKFNCDYLRRTSPRKRDPSVFMLWHISTSLGGFTSEELGNLIRLHGSRSWWDQKLLIRAQTVCLHHDQPQSSDSGLPNTVRPGGLVGLQKQLVDVRHWNERDGGDCGEGDIWNMQLLKSDLNIERVLYDWYDAAATWQLYLQYLEYLQYYFNYFFSIILSLFNLKPVPPCVGGPNDSQGDSMLL